MIFLRCHITYCCCCCCCYRNKYRNRCCLQTRLIERVETVVSQMPFMVINTTIQTFFAIINIISTINATKVLSFAYYQNSVCWFMGYVYVLMQYWTSYKMTEWHLSCECCSTSWHFYIFACRKPYKFDFVLANVISFAV